jgi:hypothetical protein
MKPQALPAAWSGIPPNARALSAPMGLDFQQIADRHLDGRMQVNV